ncbi:MAG: hypothetical protein FK731_05065 [Asgard group archaeon]|nr:hypothetical protein [Asgard group archaeon]
MSNKKKVISSSLLFALLFTCFIVGKPIEAKSTYEPFFTLVAKTGIQVARYDILNLIWQQLRRIGIEVVPILYTNWGELLDELILYNDFDLCYVDFTEGEGDPDWSPVYCENGSLNFLGYDTSLDWDEELGTGKNEWYLQEGKLIMPPDSEERIQHYWEWEYYSMDKILPLLPTFLPKTFYVSWPNLQGFDVNEGLKTSWGKISWNGLHYGQESTSEIIINSRYLDSLNPLTIQYMAKNDAPSFIFDSLITYDYDSNFYPHLAYDWTFLNDTHLRMNLRQGIKWQIDPDGLFPDEYFDANDVVFSFFAWKHFPFFSYKFSWIKDVQKVDQYTVDFVIDQDPSTTENEPYAPLFKYIVREILPEHYLNQTQLEDGKTPDISHSSWTTFSTNCFGTSLFKLDTYNEIETNLLFFEDSWWLDPSVDKTNMNFESRFGDFSSNITKLKIKTNIDDITTIFTQFELGQFDLINIGSNFILKNKFQENPDFVIDYTLPFTFAFLGFNIRENRDPIGSRDPAPGDPSITKGLAIRKAISYSIDRDEINQVMFGGEFLIQDYPIYQRLGKWCNPNIIRYNHNLDKAREYMRKAGYGEEFPQGRLDPIEITGIVFSTIIVVGTISFISYRLYKKTKL